MSEESFSAEEETLEELKAKYNKLKEDRANSSLLVKTQSSSLKKKNSEYAALRLKCDALESDNYALRQQIEELKGKLKASRMNKTDQEINSLKRELKVQDKLIKRIEDENEKLISENEILNHKFKALQEEYQKLEDKMKKPKTKSCPDGHTMSSSTEEEDEDDELEANED